MDPVELHREVFLVNERFYQAFEQLNIKLMDQVWAQDERVQCIHPGWERLTGWRAVRDSWVRIFNHTLSMKFTVTELHLTVHGGVAWIVCTENIETEMDETIQKSRVVATNVFEYREGRWVMVHHHGSPVFSSPTES